MTRFCTVCAHHDRQQIDLALIAHASSLRDIGERFGLGKNVLFEHKRVCLGRMVKENERLRAMLGAQQLEDKLLAVEAEIQDVIQRNKSGVDDKMLLAACREARAGVDSMARIAGVGQNDLHEQLSEVQRQLDDLRRQRSGYTDVEGD